MSVTTTRAQVIDSFGAADRLHPAELPLVAPGVGQVQIRVAAAAVNPVDLTTRAGRNIPAQDARFPMVIGWDAAGTVEQLGDGVEGWAVGDRVAAMTFQPLDQNGTYTQYLNLAADLLARVPDGLTLERAATIPLAGLTASQLVRSVDLAPGATLLVNGPLGAVGRLVVQLARREGVTVVAVVKPADRGAVLELGAAEVVDRGEFTAVVPRLHPGGVDAAVDLVGGVTAHATLASVRDGGAYTTSVPQYMDPTGAFEPERGIRFQLQTVHPDTPELTDLLQAAERGELTTAVERTYPLTEAAQAHDRQEQGGLRGKLILIP
jgi:NADPH:quinone reductase-like Zn-dependent oxidoreductase